MNINRLASEVFDQANIDGLASEVFEWAEATFPGRTDATMALKLYKEIGEMIESGGDPLEVADVFILVLDYAARKGVHLGTAIPEKLEINKNRQWTIDPNTGVSHHV